MRKSLRLRMKNGVIKEVKFPLLKETIAGDPPDGGTSTVPPTEHSWCCASFGCL
jgi:hypothetical protein